MANYRTIVYYHFKEGQEKAGYQLLEKEISKHGETKGCMGFELLRNEKDPSRVLGIATWQGLEQAQQFQKIWQETENQLNKMSQERPHHEFFKVCHTVQTSLRKAA